MTNPSSHYQPKTVAEIIQRYKKTILFWPLACLVLGGLYFVFCPRTYRSEARLFLRVGRESVGIDPAATAGQTMQLYTADRKDEVKSAEGIFRSRSVAAQVVDKLGPDVVLGRGDGSGEGPAPKKNFVASLVGKPIGFVMGIVRSLDPISEREEAIIKFENSLSVEGERQATVIVVHYKAPTPPLAQKICDTFVEVVQQEHMRVHRSEESAPFFTEQQERLRQQVDQALDALRIAKNELGLASVEQRRTTLEAQYSAVELDRLSTDQQLATSQASIENLQKQLSNIPEREIAAKRSIPNQGADMLRDRLYELQVKSMDLKARYNDAHPLLVAANDQLEEAKKVLADQSDLRTETNDEINPIHRDLLLAVRREQSTVAGLKARLLQLDEQKGSVLADISKINEQDIAIDQLTRDADLARSKYVQYAQTMEETRIDRELQTGGISNISVAQQATLAEKPVNPSKAMTAAGSLLSAVAGVFALVLFGERNNVAAPAAYAATSMSRRLPRRRPRRELASKTNGHAPPAELPGKAK